MRRLALLAVAAAATLPATASGQITVGIGDGPLSVPVDVVETGLTARGSVSIDFHGDRAAGCEAAGLCDVSGTVTWAPERDGALVAFGYDSEGTRYSEAFLLFGGGPGRVTTTSTRVRRGAAGRDGLCVDGLAGEESLIGSERRSGRSIEVSLTGGGGSFPPTDNFRTRCAGPTASDIAALLPRHVLTTRQVERGRIPLDFSAEREFAAHGLAGTVRSTVVLRLGRGQRSGVDDTEHPPGLTRVRRRRALDVTYRIESVSGQAIADVQGLADPDLCGPLDACGLLGTVTVAPAASSGVAFLSATARLRTPPRDLSRALGLVPGGRPRGVRTYGFAYWERDDGTVESRLTRDGATACRDSEPLLGGGGIGLKLSGNSVRVIYGSSEASQGPDPLHTRCPGPGIADVASDRALASGTVPLSAFRDRRVTLRLTRGGAWSGDGYSGATRSDVTVVLRRTRIRRSVQEETELVDVIREP